MVSRNPSRARRGNTRGLHGTPWNGALRAGKRAQRGGRRWGSEHRARSSAVRSWRKKGARPLFAREERGLREREAARHAAVEEIEVVLRG
jgi:hypothetical protein